MENSIKQIRDGVRFVALHEFGKIAVANSAGINTGSVVISTSASGTFGQAEILINNRIKSVEAVQNFLCKRILILYAGAIAQALDEGCVDGTSAKILFSNEYENKSKATENLITLAAIIISDDNNHSSIMDRASHELWEKCKTMIEKQSDLIEMLSETMANKFDVNTRECVMSAQEIAALTCNFYGLSSLEPVERCGEVENTGEA